MRIVFMGTSEFAATVLGAMLAAGYRPVGVVTQPDRPQGRQNRVLPTPVKALALAAGLEVIQPVKLRTGSLTADTLQRWAPDLNVVAAYGRILPENVLACPRLGCVNVHASLLPRHRGAAPIQHAILAGDRETGVTLMRMDAGLDTGPILATRSLPIGPEETAAELHDRLAALGGALLVESLPGLAAQSLVAVPQDDTLATLAPPLSRDDGCIDWSLPAAVLHDRVRGLHPWPGTHTTWGGQLVKVFPPALADPDVRPDAAPGTLLATTGGTLTVACGAGVLRLCDIQLACKKRMLVADFLRGCTLTVGGRFGEP